MLCSYRDISVPYHHTLMLHTLRYKVEKMFHLFTYLLEHQPGQSRSIKFPATSSAMRNEKAKISRSSLYNLQLTLCSVVGIIVPTKIFFGPRYPAYP